MDSQYLVSKLQTPGMFHDQLRMVNRGVRNGLHAEIIIIFFTTHYGVMLNAFIKYILQLIKIFSLLYDTEKEFDVMQRFPTTLFLLKVELKFTCDVKCKLLALTLFPVKYTEDIYYGFYWKLEHCIDSTKPLQKDP